MHPTPNGSETMKQIQGSSDGINWVPYAIKGDEKEAREAAASCILKTNHMYVRIIEVTA
tara:strand:+ start:1095 stop:1271 length:177 start_codon:yes stop_codon:yes gene_type:complete